MDSVGQEFRQGIAKMSYSTTQRLRLQLGRFESLGVTYMMGLDSSAGFFIHITNAWGHVGHLYGVPRPFHDVTAHGFSSMSVPGSLNNLYVTQDLESPKALQPFITQLCNHINVTFVQPGSNQNAVHIQGEGMQT